MLTNQDKEIENILNVIDQLRESGLDGKIVIYVKESMIQKNCNIVTDKDLTE